MARVVVPGVPHHVTQRGVRRNDVFFCEADYELYIHLLSDFCRKCGTEIWAYCLMTNHIHLVMVPSTEDGLRASLGEAHRSYTRHINLRMHSNTGRPLGDDSFVDMLELKLDEILRPLKRGRKCKDDK